MRNDARVPRVIAMANERHYKENSHLLKCLEANSEVCTEMYAENCRNIVNYRFKEPEDDEREDDDVNVRTFESSPP